MATSETGGGVDVLSTHPNKQTELRYRINVDESGTKATLASILAKRANEATDGASLTVAIDAVGGELVQRVVIDDLGNVGIGNAPPQARLHVGGNGRFDGPLTVQAAVTGGSLSIGGAAEVAGSLAVGGDVVVSGKFRAIGLAGDGGELSNVVPKSGSVGSEQLAEDSKSLSKVSGGGMVVSGGPRSRFDVKGDFSVQGSVSGTSADPAVAGVHGIHTAGQAAVIGTSDGGRGVLGISKAGQGVWGHSETSTGVVGVSKSGWGVSGEGGTGVVGIGKSWIGVYGETTGAASSGPAGVWGEGKQSGNGVKGQTSLANAAGVIGINVPNAGPGVEGWGNPAGLFRGECRAASFPRLSDGRLKTNVVPVSDVLEKLKDLRAVFFEWNGNEVARSTGKREIGVVAQEVEGMFPELVTTWDDDKGYKAVDYGQLATVLLEAVKELARKLEILDERVLRLDRLMESSSGSLREPRTT